MRWKIDNDMKPTVSKDINQSTFIKILDKDYEVQATPVTRQQWLAMMGTDPSYFKHSGLTPVETVSWDDAQEFIGKLNKDQDRYVYRLPTEEEWEHFARAGTTTEYSFGDDVKKLKDYAWYWDNSESKTHPVALKKPNPWGLYDVHGNVWEWTSSPQGSYRVIRGGSWYYSAGYLRSAYRVYGTPSNRNNVVGLRLVRTPVSLERSNSVTLDSSSKPVRKPERSESSSMPWQLEVALRLLDQHPRWTMKQALKKANELIELFERSKR